MADVATKLDPKAITGLSITATGYEADVIVGALVRLGQKPSAFVATRRRKAQARSLLAQMGIETK